jgi:type II secretory pathway pseudopilin PulG
MKEKKQKFGFSLIDVLMAVAVIAIGLIGVMSLLVQNIQAARVNKNFLVASMLAQEGIEIVRSLRDANWLKNPSPVWYDDIYSGPGVNYYAIDKDDSTFNTVANIDDANTDLYLKGGFYVHDSFGGTKTVFKRMITVDQTGADALTIKALVQWKNNIGTTRHYEVVTYLYNWR